ncbi:MAG: TRAP transporter fused permease subunit [Trueperaceae bacterium]|nr:TRAP transporter fused permease subunit [Trueperaceae bacterium]
MTRPPRGEENAAKNVASPRVGSTEKIVAAVVALTGITLSLFQLYTSGVQTLNLFYQRGIHLTLILVLAFLLFPAAKRAWIRWPVDLAFLAAAVGTGAYLVLGLDAIIDRAGFWTDTDIRMGILATLVVLEASRRVIGPTIAIIGLVFIGYAMVGPRGLLSMFALPGILEHRGYDVGRIVSQLYLGQEGIYGLPLGVAATFVYIFVLFGAFLEITGAGQFFIDLAYAAAGRQRGGPAKASVIASGMMGSISGSAIANVVTTGAFTIPLMKKLGYEPEEAAGVEAAASTGGQVMPPIMGAGAFLIAEYTRIPYVEIVKISVLPAILYFATVYLFVDIIAAKRGMRGMTEAELPKIREVFARGWQFLVPIVVLVYFLLQNISPARVGFISIVGILAVSLARYIVRRLWLGHAPVPHKTSIVAVEAGVPDTVAAETLTAPEVRPEEGWGRAAARGLVKTIEALEIGARNAIPVSVACAVAGIVVGVVGLTGLGLKFSSLMLSFSGGNIIAALVLVMVASLILGMGLPVTASYIVLIVLTGPALTQEFGIPLIIAHLLVFWYSQDSNVTPPVALAAFAGAAIAGSNPMRTGFAAWKFAKGLYLIPLFMVFNPEIILGGPWLVVGWSILTAFAALGAFAAALEGFMFTRMLLPSRLIASAGTVAIFWPSLPIEVAGLAAIVLVFIVNLMRHRREALAVA